MEKVYYFIIKKIAVSRISVYNALKDTKEEYHYQEFAKYFQNLLTPNDISNQISLKAMFENETKDCSLEEFADKFLSLYETLNNKKYVKSLKLEGNSLKVECYNLDDISDYYKIVISYELLEDEKFKDILISITKTFETNKDLLAKEIEAIKKQEENKKIFKNSVITYLNEKKNFTITQEEAIILEEIIHNNLITCCQEFDKEYRSLHPLKLISIMGVSLTISLILAGKILKAPNNFFDIFSYFVSYIGGVYIGNKIWLKTSSEKLLEFQNDLEEKYHISYDYVQRRTVLNNIMSFYDPFTKCLKSILELAYSKTTTPLEDEINGLNSLLNEYQERDNNGLDKIYFITRLLAIKTQILLKESTVDRKYSSFFDDIKFTELLMKYFTGTIFMQDDVVNDYLSKIKECISNKNYIYVVNYQMGLTEYLYENSRDQEVKIIDPCEIENAVNIVLGRKLDGNEISKYNNSCL